MEFLGVRIGVVDVGVRADRRKQFAAIEREGEIARPVTSAAKSPATGQIGELLHGTGGCEVAVMVREANDGVGVADVNPLWVGAERIKRDAERLMEIGGKDRHLLWFAISVDAAKHLDLAGLALSEEQIAVGRETDQARVLEIGGVELNLEALGRDRPGIGGAGNYVGAVVDRLFRHGLGQVGDGEMPANAGRFVSRVCECGLAGEDDVLRHGLGGVRSRRQRPAAGRPAGGWAGCGGGGERRCEGEGGDEGRNGEEAVQMIHETSLR